MATTVFACRTCGGTMQATVQAYVAVTAEGGMVVENVIIDRATWYCENDHKAPADQVEALREHFKPLGAFGREPGSGGLDIPIFPILGQE
ncbi:MAG TPA: hypothetical protein VGH33_06880 [Isosphaeraceae bacterium]